jgi:hypothetical protein
MLAYWQYEEGSGTTAGDYFGVDNGTISGAAWTAGIKGNALDFDTGGSDRILYNGANIQGYATNGLTLETWVNLYSTNSYYGRAIAKWPGSGTDDYDFILGITGQSVYFGLWNGGQSWLQSGTISLNGWHHIVGIWDPVNHVKKAYIDGVEVGSSAQTAVDNDYQNLASGWAHSGSYALKGVKLDEVAIYNRNLSVAEIQNHFNRTSGGTDHYCQ